MERDDFEAALEALLNSSLHSERCVQPAHDRAMRDKRGDAICLVPGEFHPPNQRKYDDERCSSLGDVADNFRKPKQLAVFIAAGIEHDMRPKP